VLRLAGRDAHVSADLVDRQAGWQLRQQPQFDVVEAGADAGASPTDAVGPRAVEGIPARLTACLVATILTSVVSMSTARRSWLVDLGSWSPLGPQAPTPHPRPARPSVTGDAGALLPALRGGASVRDQPSIAMRPTARGRRGS